MSGFVRELWHDLWYDHDWFMRVGAAMALLTLAAVPALVVGLALALRAEHAERVACTQRGGRMVGNGHFTTIQGAGTAVSVGSGVSVVIPGPSTTTEDQSCSVAASTEAPR